MTTKTARPAAQRKQADHTKTEAFDNLVELNKDAFKTVDEMTQGTAECAEAFGEEALSFVRRRLDKDFAMPQKLLGCWTPQEAMAVYLDFLQTAQKDYMAEADRLAKIGQGIAKATLQMMQIEIAPEAGKGDGAKRA